MRRARAIFRELAKQRVNILLENALLTAHSDLKLAQRQGEISRNICLKFNLKPVF